LRSILEATSIERESTVTTAKKQSTTFYFG